jgi:hypothetical protein
MMDGLLLVCLTGICASPDPLLLYERVAPQANGAESVTSSSEPTSDAPMAPSPPDDSMRVSESVPNGTTIQAPAPMDREAERDASDVGIGARTTSRSTIVGIVKANSDAVRRCYERGLTDDPAFKGTIEMGWKIDRAGRVTSTNVVTSRKGSEAVEGCLRAAIAGWAFPASAEPVVVGSYPFTFDASLLHHRRR